MSLPRQTLNFTDSCSVTAGPGAVINIASVAAINPMAESPLSAPGEGTWSCEFHPLLTYGAVN